MSMVRRTTDDSNNDSATDFDTFIDEREIDQQVVDHLHGGFALLDGRPLLNRRELHIGRIVEQAGRLCHSRAGRGSCHRRAASASRRSRAMLDSRASSCYRRECGQPVTSGQLIGFHIHLPFFVLAIGHHKLDAFLKAGRHPVLCDVEDDQRVLLEVLELDARLREIARQMRRVGR